MPSSSCTEIIRHIHSNIQKDAPRSKVMYRMNNLRAGGKISGKMLGSDKGVWVWWHKQQPSKTELRERDMPKPEVSSRE